MITSILTGFNEFLFICLLLLLSTLAYGYLDALRMLRRQAFLSHVYKAEGSIRRWFWDSVLLRIVYSILALFVALAAIFFSAQMQSFDGWVLAAGVLSFSGIAWAVHRFLRHEIQPQFHGVIVLRVSAWLNLLLMAAALAVLQIIWLEVPDTRHLAFTEVLAYSWQEHTAVSAQVPILGWLLALAAVLHDATWHVLQHASRVEASAGMKLSAWLLVLFLNALKLGTLQLILLGIPSLYLQSQQQGWVGVRKRILRRSYVLPLLVIVALYLLISRIDWQAQFEQRTSHSQNNAVAAAADPCSGPLAAANQQREQAEVQQVLQERLAAQQNAASVRMERYVQETVARAFRQAETGVDAFLDWNFSISGQYQQLGMLLATTAGSGSMSQGSAQFSEYLGEQMNQYISEPLTPALAAAQADIQQVFLAEIRSSGLAYNRLLNQLVAQTSCLPQPEFRFQPSEYIDKSLVGLGVAGGAIALRFAATAGTRAASRAGIRRAIAAMFTRGASRAGAVGSGSAGALCGPAFWLCTPAIIAGTWFSIDYGLNKVDELLNREQMRAEMLASLNADQVQAAAELAEFYDFALREFYQELAETQQRQFNIRRDGL